LREALSWTLPYPENGPDSVRLECSPFLVCLCSSAARSCWLLEGDALTCADLETWTGPLPSSLVGLS
jgi:hypothetical protein